jgi:3-hydroxybutyryl-CoA dehydrogenase
MKPLGQLLENGSMAVVGAGVMGHGIAQTFALAGCRVYLYDVEQEVLDHALRGMGSNLETFAEEGLIRDLEVEEILSRVNPTLDLEEAVTRVDFVVEAAPEDMALKAELFRRMGEAAPAHAVLASNTSMLPISGFGANARGRHRQVITHWFNPPHIVPVVEVVRGEETSEKTLAFTMAVLEAVGKRPVRVEKEIPGFLVNRIQTAMFREVLSLLEQGVASVEDLDRAVKGSFGLRLGVIGVLETMDMAGLDLMLKGTSHLYRFIDNAREAQQVLREKVERGDLGVKTGRGFYDYEKAGPGSAEDNVRARDRKLIRLLKTLHG